LQDQLANRIRGFLVGRTAARASEGSGDYAVASTVGLVREQNQDAALIVRARYAGAAERDFDLAVVCDGLGGMSSGAEAAVTGMSAFVSRLVRSSRGAIYDRLLNGLRQANEEIYELLRGQGGTTLSAILVPRQLSPMICHVGDSRVYAVGPNGLSQLTRDDTLAAALSKKNEQSPAQRDSRLLQFVGMGPDLEGHIFQPEASGTTSYFLCTDGAYEAPKEVLERVLFTASGNFEAAKRLIQLSELLGGSDNASVVITPSSVPADTGRPSDGLDLFLIAPTSHMHIWTPLLVDDKRSLASDRDPGSNEPEVAAPEPEIGQGKRRDARDSGARAKKQPTKKPPRRQGRKRSDESGDELPLNETVEINFPGRDKSKP
jgi:serine/threonine protein phosphatase PrpC